MRLPGGTVIPGKVFYKSRGGLISPPSAMLGAESGIYVRSLLKVRLDNPKGVYAPGMTAEVLISPQSN